MAPNDLETPNHELFDDHVDQDDELVAKVVRQERCISFLEKGLANGLRGHLS